ncbi:hypothetical protein PC123_g21111 [Phytophthora cactorum]|nr:hypothetical protein PC123_g21111 [Phytophthora cactorum]
MVTLCCAVDAIKGKKPDTSKGEADKLQLFLAKKHGAWLDGAGAAAVTLDEDGPLRGFGDQMDPTLWVKNAKYFGENFQPGEGQIHVLVVVPEDVPMLGSERKRRRLEESPDAWIKAIKDTQVTVLPSTCEDLKGHLERELRVKAPLTDRLSLIVSAANTTGELSSILIKIFEFEPREKLSDITAGIVGAVIDPLGSGSEFATEDTYHHLWDSLIAALLRRVSNGNFRRNTNESASTGPYRPDLCFYYNNSDVCVFRGEEKARAHCQCRKKNCMRT